MATAAHPPTPHRRTLRHRAAACRDFLTTTWAGRLAVFGLVLKLLTFGADRAGVPIDGFWRVLSTAGGVALAIAFFIVGRNVIRLLRRDLLWRVRRKLIISYLFVGVVPVLLLAVFFLIAGRLLFNNISSFLVQASIREMTDDAATLSRTAAAVLDGSEPFDGAWADVRRQMTEWSRQYPSAALTLVPLPADRCAAGLPALSGAARGLPSPPLGAWSHTRAPTELPGWLPCDGFGGVVLVGPPDGPRTAAIRSVTIRNGRAIIVDLPMTNAVRERVARLTGVTVGEFSDAAGTTGAPGGAAAIPAHPPLATPGASGTFSRSQWVAMVEHVDWTSGRASPLQVHIAFDTADLYNRLSESQALFGDFLGTLLLFIAGLFLVIEIGALTISIALGRSITGSIHELFAGTEKVRAGDFTHRIAVRVKDQLGALADSFNQMTGSIEDLLRQAAEKKRLEEEMRLAREIQMSLLPRGPLVVPGMTVSALCVPAREVGGDYYDVLPLADGRVGVLIADVAGKGMSAALYMAELKGLMLSLTKLHRSPADLLKSANRLISEHLDSRSFITMTYAVIDQATCTMTYARAGHTPLMHVGPGPDGGREVRVHAPDGMVVGLRIDNGERFEAILQESTLHLSAGDTLAFFTDGVSEAMNGESDCFGEARLGHLLQAHGHLPVDELRERVWREVDAFVGAAPQHDDMTMILLRVGETVCPNQS